MAFTNFFASRLLKAVGETTEIAAGVENGTGTTTTITVPQLQLVHGALVSDSDDGASWVSTLTGTTNTFIATHASGADFSWIAWGTAKI